MERKKRKESDKDRTNKRTKLKRLREINRTIIKTDTEVEKQGIRVQGSCV